MIPSSFFHCSTPQRRAKKERKKAQRDDRARFVKPYSQLFHYSGFLFFFFSLSSRDRGTKETIAGKNPFATATKDERDRIWPSWISELFKYSEQVCRPAFRVNFVNGTRDAYNVAIYIVYANLCSLRSLCVEGMALAVQMRLLLVRYSGIMWR